MYGERDVSGHGLLLLVGYTGLDGLGSVLTEDIQPAIAVFALQRRLDDV